MSKFVSNAIHLLLCFFIIVILGVFAANQLGYETITVMSGSMEPAIHTGAMAIVDTNASYDEVAVNDVVAHESPMGLVAHRAISVTDKGIETKGDANDNSDGISTTQDNFYGIILFTIPGIGYFQWWLSTVSGKAISIVIVISLLVLSYILGSDDEAEQRKIKGGDTVE